jgi:hypothetical protein
MRLLDHSAAARAQWDAAARLDALLDLAPDVQPSAELATHLLAAALPGNTPAADSSPRAVRVLRPGRRHQPRARHRKGRGVRPHRLWGWPTLAVAASLTVVLWGVRTLPPARHELPSEVVATLGVYTTPTDVLLQWPGIDLLNTMPVVGCVDDELGCPALPVSPGLHSQSPARERHFV